jgi:hypothetical protein
MSFFCGDTLNTFAREDPKNHWSRDYRYYSSLSPEGNNSNDVWVSGIAKLGCVSEVFDAKDLVIWCTNNFEKDQRIIKLNGWSPISLLPTNLSEMLKLLRPTSIFKAEKIEDFIKAKNGGRDLFPQCFEDPTTAPKDLSTFQVSLFKMPYKEMDWLLARVLGLESTAIIPCLDFYVLHYSVKGKMIFDWSKIISSEISF